MRGHSALLRTQPARTLGILRVAHLRTENSGRGSQPSDGLTRSDAPVTCSKAGKTYAPGDTVHLGDACGNSCTTSHRTARQVASVARRYRMPVVTVLRTRNASKTRATRPATSVSPICAYRAIVTRQAMIAQPPRLVSCAAPMRPIPVAVAPTMTSARTTLSTEPTPCAPQRRV